MFKIQIAYKLSSEDKELSFFIYRNAQTMSGAIKVFEETYPSAIIYCILRCGKP